jgi:hypothetical protein
MMEYILPGLLFSAAFSVLPLSKKPDVQGFKYLKRVQQLTYNKV